MKRMDEGAMGQVARFGCVGGVLLTMAAVLVAAPGAASAGEPIATPAPTSMRSAALELVEGQIASAFADVSHLSTTDLARLRATDPTRVVLLDVRGADEHATSRIDGAVHVAPETRRAGDVVAAAGDLDGKIVVAYCSIGLRSSRLIVRIGQALKEKGAAELHNLAGGVFRWRNEGRPLVGPAGPTTSIHPYNALWRQFLVAAP